MSQVIDTKVVEMQFDNSKFEKNIETSLNSLKFLNKNIEDAGKNRNSLDELAHASDQVGISFDNMNMKSRISLNLFDLIAGVGTKAFNRISDAVAGFALNMANSLSGMQAMRDGFNEYELKMGSVQTILAGAKIIDPKTGKNIEDDAKRLSVVNDQLERLNAYSDKTIYSFKDMTSNIGKFTNAGVNLDDSVAAIQGVANVAAVSGANAGEASRAMYNFSQALSSGYIKLIDWKSIENANMATVDFKQQLLDTAVALGTVTKKGNEYITTTTDANGKVSEAFNATKMFNDSLSHQWMTSEVLTQTLKNYSTDVNEMTESQLEAYKAQLKSVGYTDKQVEGIVKLSKKAFAAATEVKTFSQMIDTLKESLGSGWAQSFEIIFGNFTEAKELWTGLNNTIDGILSPIGKARNAILQTWKDNGGRDALIKSFSNLRDAVANILAPLKELWKSLTPNTDHSGKILATISKWIEKLTGVVAKAARVIGKVIGIVLKPVIALGTLVGKGLVKLVGLIRTAFGKIVKFFSPVREAISKFTSAIITAFDKHVTARVKAFRDTITSTFDNIKKRIRNSTAIKGLVEAFTNLKNILQDAFSKALEKAGKLAETAGTYFGKLWGAIKPLISSAFTKTLSSLSGFLLPKLRKAIGFVSDRIKDLVGFIGRVNLKNSGLYKWIVDLPNKISALANSKAIKTITTTIKNFGSDAVEFLKGKFDSLKTSVDAIHTPKGLKDLFENIKNFIKTIFGKNALDEEVGKTTESLDKVGENTSEKKLTLFQKFLEGVASAFDWLKTAADKARGAIEKFIGFIITNFPKALSAFHDFLAGEDGVLQLNDISDFIYTISASLTDLMASKGLLDIGKAADNIGEAFGEIGTGISTFLKRTANKMNMSAIRDFAIALGIIAGALFVVSKIPAGKLLIAATAIGAIGAVLYKFFSLLSTSEVAQGKVAGNLSIAALLISIGVSMLAMAGSVVVLVAALAAFPYVIKQYNNLGKTFRTGMDKVKEVLKEIFDYLDHLANAKYGFRGAAALLGLVMSLSMLQKTIIKYASAETGDAMKDGLDRIKKIMDMLGEFLSSISIASLNFINIGVDFDTLGIAAIVWAIGDMMSKIIDPIERLAEIDADKYKNALKGLKGIFLDLGAFIGGLALSAKFVKSPLGMGQWIGIATTIGVMTSAITSIVSSVDLLVKINSTDPYGLNKALQSIRGIFIDLGALMIVIGAFKPTASLGTLFGMTILIAGITACVVALYPIAHNDIEGLNAAIVALGSLMIALGGALFLAGQAAGKATVKDIAMLIATTLAMTMLANTIRRLAKTGGSAGGIIAAGAAISGAALAMAGAMKLMNDVHIAPGVLAGLAILTAAIWGIAFAIAAFKSSAGGMAEGAQQVEKGGAQMTSAVKGVATESLAAISKDVVPAFFDDMFGQIGPKLKEFFGNLKVADMIKSMIEGIKERAKSFAQDFIDIGTNLIDGISTAIKDPANVEKVKNAFVELGKSLLESFKLFFGINSPSTVMAEQGGFILDGLLQGLMEFPTKLAGWITGIGTFIKDGVTGLITGTIEKGKELADGIGTGIQNGKDFVGKKASEIGKAALDKVGKVTEWGKSAVSSARSFGSKLAGSKNILTSAAGRMIVGATNTVSTIGSIFSKSAKAATGSFASAIRGGSSPAMAAAKGIVSGAKAAFNGIRSSFVGYGKDAAEGFRNGINSMISKIAEKAREMVRKAKNAAKAEQNSNSPSKDFMEFGNWAAEGYAIGLTNRKSIRFVTNNAKKLVNAAKNATSGEGLDLGNLSIDSRSAVDSLAAVMSQISDNVDNDSAFTPTIRPVVDMSGVTEGAMGIASLLEDRRMSVGVDMARNISDDFEHRRNANDVMFASISKLTNKIGSMTDTMNSRSLNNYITVDGASDPEAFADGLIRSFRLNARTV